MTVAFSAMLSIGLCLQPASVGFGSVWVADDNGRVLRLQLQR